MRFEVGHLVRLRDLSLLLVYQLNGFFKKKKLMVFLDHFRALSLCAGMKTVENHYSYYTVPLLFKIGLLLVVSE